MTRFALVLAVMLLLAGCGNPWADDRPTRAEIFAAGWVNDDLPLSARTAVPERPVYCYRTIADEDCHAEPVPGGAARLRGFIGPAVPAAGAP